MIKPCVCVHGFFTVRPSSVCFVWPLAFCYPGNIQERLGPFLLGKDGHSKWFDKPGETIELPVGQYQLQESRLDGGYVCVQRAGIENKWISVAENKPAAKADACGIKAS